MVEWQPACARKKAHTGPAMPAPEIGIEDLDIMRSWVDEIRGQSFFVFLRKEEL
jgi:hypothetical protein